MYCCYFEFEKMIQYRVLCCFVARVTARLILEMCFISDAFRRLSLFIVGYRRFIHYEYTHHLLWHRLYKVYSTHIRDRQAFLTAYDKVAIKRLLPLSVPSLCFNYKTIYVSLFVFGATAPSGPGSPHSRGFQITRNDAPQSVGLLWMSDQPIVETSTSQHTILTIDKHPCPRWDSNPQSQQESGRRPTPQTARPLGPAIHVSGKHNFITRKLICVSYVFFHPEL